MSEETEKPNSNEKPVNPKPAKLGASKKPAFNAFLNPKNNFSSPKAGNPGRNGKVFKGSSKKKG